MKIKERQKKGKNWPITKIAQNEIKSMDYVETED